MTGLGRTLQQANEKIKELEAEIENLRDDLTIFIDDTNTQSANNRELRDENVTLTKENEKLKAENKRYKKIRKPLLKFAVFMESILKENDWKTSYTECGERHLFGKLLEEVEELRQAIYRRDGDVSRECADVADYCMVIFDNAKRETEEDNREQKPNTTDQERQL